MAKATWGKNSLLVQKRQKISKKSLVNITNKKVLHQGWQDWQKDFCIMIIIESIIQYQCKKNELKGTP